MVWRDPALEAPTIPEDERYDGTELDSNILKVLPKGVTIKCVSTYGASFWSVSRAVSSKVTVTLPSGQEKSYFAKVYNAPRAFDIARGEYESTALLRSAVPENVPRPVGYDLLSSAPTRSFFVAEFRNMTDKLPGTVDLVNVVAKIHQKVSPTGKFGYPLTTFAGKHAVDNGWCDTWEEWFTRAMRDTMAAERAVHGPDDELEELSRKVLSKVIPRLIRPLETEGRSIKPVLLHGDLWHGNISIDNRSKQPVLYNPCCFYGHNEYDLAMWRAGRYLTDIKHVRAYFKVGEKADLVDDQDDRHALYGMRHDLATSICWPKNKEIRYLAMEEMRRLVGKYCGGYEEYIARKHLEPRLADGGKDPETGAGSKL